MAERKRSERKRPTPPEEARAQLDALDEKIESLRSRLRHERHEDERHFMETGDTDRDIDNTIVPPG